MERIRACAVFLLCGYLFKWCAGVYNIPEIEFKAFTPSGLRVSIPADPGVELIAFHGKLNEPISTIEPGEFSEDVTKPKNGKFTYFNPSLKLKVGDVVNYWVFVQHDQFGYRKDGQAWTVPKLFSQAELTEPESKPNTICSSSPTKVLNKPDVCSGETLLKDRFKESSINEDNWLVEQYIPDAPDYEFVIYKKDRDVVFPTNNLLHIKPKVSQNRADLVKAIDLSAGCTRQEVECRKDFFGIYQNPITSGRIVSKIAFCFGRVKIRAKLPKGDWLYTEMYLEDIKDSKRKIWIAYTRGNEVLTGNDGGDIGSRLLFGGPVVNPKEPFRSDHLVSYRNGQAVANEMHTFTLKWTRDQMEFYFDDLKYGDISATTLRNTGFDRENMVRLVLGVGAGGVNDFPDNYKSGPNNKPWKNNGRSQVKDFFESRTTWLPTWNSDISQLQVEYIKISAL